MEDKKFQQEPSSPVAICDSDDATVPEEPSFQEMWQLLEEIKASRNQPQIVIYLEPRRRFLFF
jgi:hypothetical protein